MEELLEILEDIDPDIDYTTAEHLIDGKLLDSFSIVSLVSEIANTFDIEISPKYLVPENFNSAAAMWSMICRLREEE
ncbi:acyl carrier protein [Acutalibacter muris]|uniref:Acyl carrier protein n=1 Tax=Acutalibacter muris TaxID=1796620 RepID=A0A1Z2XQD8_9FIRM|nr:acyl carrier protein [Acutalibacter muris]ANU52713.1 acyl carrier protein [Hungateiclostridiaceae bacterium KB18]ASB40619.1 acyl carrier protein [Acutalibacter muris]QQR29896.1 acyl carrier protein [Acutalibacter muris]